jgi:hypothetical protein
LSATNLGSCLQLHRELDIFYSEWGPVGEFSEFIRILKLFAVFAFQPPPGTHFLPTYGLNLFVRRSKTVEDEPFLICLQSPLAQTIS